MNLKEQTFLVSIGDADVLAADLLYFLNLNCRKRGKKAHPQNTKKIFTLGILKRVCVVCVLWACVLKV